MYRRTLILIFILCFFLPQITAAEPTTAFEKKRHAEFSLLAKKIIASKFEPLTITVEGATLEKALTNAAIVAREYIDTYKISSLMCKCLGYTDIVTKEERTILRHWDFDVSRTESEAAVRLMITLDEDQLAQLALFNMWPLLHRNFKT